MNPGTSLSPVSEIKKPMPEKQKKQKDRRRKERAEKAKLAKLEAELEAELERAKLDEANATGPNEVGNAGGNEEGDEGGNDGGNDGWNEQPKKFQRPTIDGETVQNLTEVLRNVLATQSTIDASGRNESKGLATGTDFHLEMFIISNALLM